MSRTVAEQSAHELEEITTHLAWRQWRAIGGSAATKEPWHSIVDPEALILASLFLVDREPRITEILFSWVELNAHLLSVQRLKNLQRDYPRQIHKRVADFAGKTRTLAKHPKWRSLSDEPNSHSLAVLPETRRATRPQTTQPTNLLLRLRLAFGVGTKADVLALTLGSERPVTIREIADGLSYTLVGIRSAVYDLTSAGFIIPAGGKPAAFAAPHREWDLLLDLRIRPRWVAWHHWFAFVIDYITWSEKAATRQLGDYAIDVKIRELIARHALFFRHSAHELSAAAFHGEMGSYAGVLRSLIEWAQRQEKLPAV
jgi:hypothetical protein